jgi:hypothetical protein
MARPRKNASSSSGASEQRISPGQAAYVVERLLSERRISQGEINRYVSEMGREISDLEARLQRLREAHGGQIAAAAAGIGAALGVAAIVRRGPGRPPGSGRGPGRPPGKRGPGRPPGSGRGPGRPPGKRGPGRPPKSLSAPAATTGTDTAAAGGTSAAAATTKRRRGRKPSSITGDQLASRQLQGRYLALVRQFAEAKRAQYARIAKERGREAAIKEMMSALGK